MQSKKGPEGDGQRRKDPAGTDRIVGPVSDGSLLLALNEDLALLFST
jgi:hypothetical protein